MLKKLATVLIVTALVCAFSGSSALANNSDEPADNTNVPSGTPARTEAKPNEQLKNNLQKLVADAKAGKIAPAAKSQMQPAKSNSWSKQTKIIVGVAIAATVVVLILVVKHEKDHFFDDFHPFQN
ncbi:MAG TPA: hypothetical protein VGN90_11350 [Pyrinomonadaceae bacterium]|jgi:hypothetical protein|nr:hypothetical protein [Pyrinomonadaceae bacterium]